MQSTWLIWDLAALIVIVLCVCVGAKKGFVRMVISFFSYILAAIVANILSTPAAKWIYENIVGDFVKGVLTGSLRQAMVRHGTIEEFIEHVPLWLRIPVSHVPEESMTQIDFSQNAAIVIDVFVDTALGDTIIWLLSCFVFLVLFALLSFIINQIAKMFTFVDRIPLVGTLNTVLGGCAGGAEAVIILLAVAVLAHLIIVFSGGVLSWVNPEIMDKSFLFRFFYILTSF